RLPRPDLPPLWVRGGLRLGSNGTLLCRGPGAAAPAGRRAGGLEPPCVRRGTAGHDRLRGVARLLPGPGLSPGRPAGLAGHRDGDARATGVGVAAGPVGAALLGAEPRRGAGLPAATRVLPPRLFLGGGGIGPPAGQADGPPAPGGGVVVRGAAGLARGG